MTFIIAIASAPSVPGLGQTCQSASLAVLEAYASMTTTLEPFFWASLIIWPVMKIGAD